MGLDLDPGPGGPPEVIETEQGPYWLHETWRISGSRGDEVRAEAWLSPDPGPVVVVGHGVESDRRSPHISGMGKGWARRGVSIVAADAPRHGDRAGPLPDIVSVDLDLLQWWVGDQRRLTDAVGARLPDAPVGYYGVSMGTLFGVHLVAADARFRAAVFAVGASTVAFLPERFPGRAEELAAVAAIADPAAAAPGVAPRPVLMLQADRDELFSRRSALALYDAFEPPKEITFFPGTHAEWRHPGQWDRRTFAFLSRALER
jgi:hypothetical protein